MGIDKFAMLILYTGLYISDCCIYGDGPDCRFPCRCKEDGCDTETGKCVNDECMEGWKGYGCRIGNVAYNKTTIGNTNATESLVDGHLNQRSCLLISENKMAKRAQWNVNLGSKHTISKLIIVKDNNDISSEIEVRIGMSRRWPDQGICTKTESLEGSQTNITCADGQNKGQHISIRKIGPENLTSIYMCEVIAIGYELIDCSAKSCLGEQNDGKCDELTGCSKCITGKQRPDCKKDCVPGTYGVNCNDTCGYCASPPCTPGIGSCIDGCTAGYKGNTCKDKCDSGTWGPNCATTCGHCKDGHHHCNITNGKCEHGCKGEYYGEYCDKKCGHCKNDAQCEPANGHCLGGCNPGYRGELCKQGCPEKHWGDNCSTQCGHCYGTNQCNHVDGNCPHGCETGYKDTQCESSCDAGTWGKNCGTKCGLCAYSKTCDGINGHCEHCKHGYKLPHCTDKCDYGYWGPNCNNTCGHCKYNKWYCTNTDGTCTNGCMDGYFGKRCNLTCGKCKNDEQCEDTTGNCPYGCSPGYEGDRCQNDCSAGKWGEGCSTQCGHCYDTKKCNHVNGSCLGGCIAGYWGRNCDKQCGLCFGSYECDRVHGTCPHGCVPGYKSPNCTDKCQAGFWGRNCDKQCGLCFGSYECNRVHGTCPHGCVQGYKSPNCTDKCQAGFWGRSCYATCLQHNCAHNETCNRINGHCTYCEPGYKLPTCKDPCDKHFWGPHCHSECGKCDYGDNCHHVNGSCLYGCKAWFIGNTCNTEVAMPSLPRKEIEVTGISSSALAITWNQYQPLYPHIGEHYFYKIQYNDSGTVHFEKVHHLERSTRNSFNITGLEYNTQYEVRVIPFRTQNSRKEAGKESEIMTEKTLCREPSAPVFVVENDKEGWLITLLDIGYLEIGCDTIMTYSLNISAITGGETVYSESVFGKRNTTLKYKPSFNGTVVWLEVVNNGGLRNTSIAEYIFYIADDSQSDGYDLLILNKSETAGLLIVGILMLFGLMIVGVVLYRKRHTLFKSQTQTKDDQPAIINMVVQVQENDDNAEYENINPKKDDLRFPTTYISVTQLGEYIKFKDTEKALFEKEYTSIKLTSVTATFTKANQPDVICKNRYKNIKAYDHSRVVLECQNGDSNMDYINACFIPGYNGGDRKYIAGQGPLPHTIADTWRMIWQYDVNRVVMVTSLTEMGKSKCDRYWPRNVGESAQYGELEVKLEAVEEYTNYTIRQLTCSMSEGSPKSVVQFHFTTWPDKDVVETAFPLLMFRHKVHSFNDIATGPLFVHCSAGIGRTGTYIAIDYLIDQGLAEGKIDVHQCVTFLREHRMNMVQTAEQYKFIHKILHDAFTFGDTNIECTDIIHKVKDLQSSQEIPNQFKVIGEWQSSTNTVGKTQSGQLPENANKNRENAIIPSDSCRPFLKTQWSDGNDYINAVYVNTYRKRKAIIVTQFPLENTTVDFWRLVYDHHCEDIFMLGGVQQDENVYYNYENSKSQGYWPNLQSKCESYGPLCVTAENENLKDDIISREFTIEHKGDAFLVKHTQVADWLDGQLPDMKLFLNILSQLTAILEAQRENPILIQCCNGADTSGLLVAALFMMERMKIDQEVDVVNAVRSVKAFRQQFVHTQDQFEFLYKVAMSYQNMSSVYENAI